MNIKIFNFSHFLDLKGHFTGFFSQILKLYPSFLAFLVFLLIHHPLSAQDESSTFIDQLNVWIQDFIESQEEDSEFQFNTIFESVIEHSTQPYDLNKVTFEELQSIILLNDQEINEIIKHRLAYGDFIDIYELQSVDNLPIDKARLLSNLVYVNQNVLTQYQSGQGTSELYTKWERKIQTEEAYRETPPDYNGDQNYLYLRYLYRNSSLFNAGLTIEKDAGEALLKDSKPDYIAGYIIKENIGKVVRTIVLGDYTANFGQGLILQNGYGFGKSSYTTSIKRNNKTIRPYSSADENIAFRGIATQINPTEQVQTNLMLSKTHIDGNLIFDGDEQVAFSSFQTSGLHRSENELIDKNAIDKTVVAANTKYADNRGNSFGINGIYNHYSLPLNRSDQIYNALRFEGQSIWNVSTDFNYFWNSVNLFGELAYSANGGWARTLNAVTSLDPKIDLAVNYRDFDSDYQAPSATTFSESSAVENEQGAYIGLEYRPTKEWKINALADYWNHEWFKFGIDGPSDGNEYLLKIAHTIRRKRSIYLQYRYERKQENADGDSRNDIVVDRSTHRLRLNYQQHISSNIELRSRVEVSRFNKENFQANGILLYQDLIYSNLKSPFSLAGRLAYFDVNDFDARIYAYERDLLYEFSIPFFNGRGWRYYTHLKYKVNRSIMAEIRWSHTIYTDGRETIGSGNTEILGNDLSQIKAQIRFKF